MYLIFIILQLMVISFINEIFKKILNNDENKIKIYKSIIINYKRQHYKDNISLTFLHNKTVQ